MGHSTARLRVPAIVAVFAVLVACGGSTATTGPTEASTPELHESATSAATLESTLSPEPTPGASNAATPSADANTFVSDQYKYALTLPPGAALVAWHGADRPWDGHAKVDIAGGPYTDRTSVAEGGLLIIGSEAENLDEFFGRFEANGPRFRGCNAAKDRLDVTIGGVPAIAFTQICGEDESDAFGRVALFNDGRGVGASILTTLGNEVAARDRLVELLDGLEWRTD
jgi:hypothetical protein